MKTKVVVLLAGGMVALLLLARYVALRGSGLPVGWMLYLGLPITASGVLFALRLVNLGAGWGPGPGRTADDSPAAAPAPSERLRELDDLHAKGLLSDAEYSARRLRIIAGM
ncbi:SHOCT domain-containing protein [Mycobacterium sp. 050134]|uniref:SHOCT domain-containing protein n=1 Tax=Mycobacterium sp. 050134 TaxID=3096111 RepID=UPI002ED8C703